MKIWETLVGVRDDLPSLRQKWWHQVAIVFCFATAFLAFFVSAAVMMGMSTITPTPDNVFSLSLVTFAKGRPGQVSRLTDLAALPGSIGILSENQLSPLEPATGLENIRCESPPALKARQTVTEKDAKTGTTIVYTAIADHAGQPDRDLRYCAATSAYASLAGENIVSYRVNSAITRWQSGGRAARSLAISAAWLILSLNLYYRVVISIYAARRRRRIRKPAQTR